MLYAILKWKLSLQSSSERLLCMLFLNGVAALEYCRSDTRVPP